MKPFARFLALATIFAALPVGLISQAAMFRLAFDAWPLWVFALAGLAQMLCLIATALWIDGLKARPTL